MKKKTENKSVSQIAFEKCAKARRGFSMSLSLFFVIITATLLLAFFLPESLILSLPFLVAPSFFAYTAMNIAPENIGSEFREFFFLFRLYFSQLFSGSYKLLRGFLKSILAFIVAALVISTFYSLFFLQTNPDFMELLGKMAVIDNPDELMVLYSDYINNSVSFKNYIFVSTTIATGFAAFIYINHISKNSIKLYFNFTRKQQLPQEYLTLLNNIVMKDYKKPILTDYFKSLWIFIPLYILSIALGGVISYLVIEEVFFVHSLIIGLFIFALISLPFMNYYSRVIEVLFDKYKACYIHAFNETQIEALKELEQSIEFSNEQKEEIKKFLDENNIKEDIDINNKEQEGESKQEDKDK